MTIPKVNLGLIFILFVLFAGINFAVNVSECGNLTGSGDPVLT